MKRSISHVRLLLIIAIGLAGCGHKLVPHNGDMTVNVYANRQQFDRVSSMKSQGGAAALLGGLGESVLAKKVAGDTPVKVLSTDDEGATIEVTRGPDKGVQGYIAKDNLD